MGDTFLKYPKAAIAMDSGDLAQVTNWNLDISNNGKLKHTLRRSPSGAVTGVNEGTLSFDLDVDENGPERDYITFVKRGTVKQIRAKLPGGLTIVLNGMYTQKTIDQPLDDACKISMKFICGADKAS